MNAFQELEPDINDLMRWADLVLSVYRDEEMEEIKITEDGKVTACALQHLVGLIRDLKKKYHEAYEHSA